MLKVLTSNFLLIHIVFVDILHSALTFLDTVTLFRILGLKFQVWLYGVIM